MAHVEAFIDFGEDENIEDTVMEEGLYTHQAMIIIAAWNIMSCQSEK